MRKNRIVSIPVFKSCLQSVIKISILILFIFNWSAIADEANPFTGNEIAVKGDKIYIKNQLFAELRYFTDEQYNSINGIAVYYFKDNREIWIYPEKGWSVRWGGKEYFAINDINRIWNNYSKKHLEWSQGRGKTPSEIAILFLGGEKPTKSQIIKSKIFAVKISEDGKYVYYKTQGIFFDSTQKYSVEYGN